MTPERYGRRKVRSRQNVVMNQGHSSCPDNDPAVAPAEGTGRRPLAILRVLALSSCLSMPVIPIGLCVSCEHQKLIRSGRGSEFSMCLRYKDDPPWPKYPRLPVLQCAGYERKTS